MIAQYAGWAMAAVFAVAWLFAEHAAAKWKAEAEEWEWNCKETVKALSAFQESCTGCWKQHVKVDGEVKGDE